MTLSFLRVRARTRAHAPSGRAVLQTHLKIPTVLCHLEFSPLARLFYLCFPEKKSGRATPGTPGIVVRVGANK